MAFAKENVRLLVLFTLFCVSLHGGFLFKTLVFLELRIQARRIFKIYK
jgi:hypothetical protein